MFESIFVEEDVYSLDYVQQILKRFPKAQVNKIKSVESIWGRVKKPYLHKRDRLNLFLGVKKGTLIKEAPDAYGTKGDPHYYFIHSYNCIYECQYCYLQGYFNTPDIVLFVNHQDIINEMKQVLQKHPQQKVWFHAGEFSDSLALSSITKEWSLYWDFFEQHPNALLELRTKSANTKLIEDLPPLSNAITSFSLMPEESSKKFDLKTPSTELRLKAISRLSQHSHPIGIHFDPIIYSENFKQDYKLLLDQLEQSIPLSSIRYFSLGVVRFTKDVFREVQNNYPDSEVVYQEYSKSFDSKIRYPKAMRSWILSGVKEELIKKGVCADKIYLCME